MWLEQTEGGETKKRRTGERNRHAPCAQEQPEGAIASILCGIIMYEPKMYQYHLAFDGGITSLKLEYLV